MSARAVGIVAAALLALPLAACASRGAAPRDGAGAEVTSDTLRGVVQVVGNEPGVVTLVPAGGTAPVAVLVDADAALRAAAGLEVMVRGRARGTSDALPVATRAFAVRSFAVRAVDGAAAVDGTLEREGDRLALRLADGTRVRLGAPPPALQELVGARVYWVGPFDAPPRAYGILAR